MFALNSSESIWFYLLVAIITIQIYKSYQARDNAELWSPMSMVTLTVLYYCVIGPLISINSNETDLRSIDHRQYMDTAWQGAFISYTMIYLGFTIGNFKRFKIYPQSNADRLQKESKILFLGTLLIIVGYAGTGFINQINFLDNKGSGIDYSGALGGYVMQAVIFFITPALLSMPSMLEKRIWIPFVLYSVIAASLYITGAFRWRLVVLLLASMSTYHLMTGKKINLKLVAIILIPFLILMGALEVARTYGRGINTQAVSQYQSRELIDNSFKESAVFMATGYLMERYEEKLPFTHFAFIENTIAMPIPRALWPEKPAGEYMLGINDKLYGKHGVGQAYMNYGEFFVAWGWTGIVVFSFLLGLLIKYYWLRFMANRNNTIAILTISIINAMMYVVISRGYLAQVVTLFIFALLPLEVVKYRLRKQQR